MSYWYPCQQTKPSSPAGTTGWCWYLTPPPNAKAVQGAALALERVDGQVDIVPWRLHTQRRNPRSKF